MNIKCNHGEIGWIFERSMKQKNAAARIRRVQRL